ncbi:MAG: alkaline phosphatase family protein [Candidatus Lernaella stagnicola]|nr:alkaline phosphatase family protein [Candidatus Lernaella stagnicola]
MGRILVLGIDGAEPSLLFRWAEDGHLPHFQRWLETSSHGPLRSTIHPLTPQAWTSMITGVNPGRHGIFDFGKRAAGRYDVELVTSRDRRAPAFWQFLPEGAQVGVANVPLTWPPEPLPGFMVTGMHTPSLPEGVWPPEILAQLGDGYQIDAMIHWYDRPEPFLRDVFAMLSARHQAFLRLWEAHALDVGFFVYVAADRVQHALWGEMEEQHIEHPGQAGDLGDAVFRTYLELDRCLGEWLERLGPEDHLMVVSDHGFGSLRRDVYLNRVLIDAGLLRFDPDKVRAYQPPPEPENPDRKHAWVKENMPPAQDGIDDDQLLALGLGDPRKLTFATVDWSCTVAYAAGLCGNVWLNLAGREPEGIVDEDEAPRVREQIKAALLAVVDPEDGRPVVDAVLEKEDIYHGEAMADAPDLLVMMRDYAYTTRGATEFWGRTPVGPVVVGHTGNHRLHGVFAAAGPKVAPGRFDDADILDVLPTLFHLAGWPVPADLDGLVLVDSLRPEHRDVAVGPPTPQVTTDPADVSERQRQIIVQRLKDLGYLG